MSELVVELTDANFEEIINGSQPVFVDFWAEWCGPCKMLAPVIPELAEKYEGRAVVGKVNVDLNPEITSKYAIRSIPTLMVFKSGQAVGSKIGAIPLSEMSELIDAAL
ncbi:MAG: thioredoxin [Oceanobacter sp.]